MLANVTFELWLCDFERLGGASYGSMARNDALASGHTVNYQFSVKELVYGQVYV